MLVQSKKKKRFKWLTYKYNVLLAWDKNFVINQGFSIFIIPETFLLFFLLSRFDQ